MEQRRHNTRHAAALAAAAALAEEPSTVNSNTYSSSHQSDEKPSSKPGASYQTSGSPNSATSSSASSPVTVKIRKTPTPPMSSKASSKKDMYESFQNWALKTYGDSAKTKTVTRRKYNRILKILKGEEQTNAENSKFRFWVKAKGFRIGPPPSQSSNAKKSDHVLYIPCSKLQAGMAGKDETTVYKKVAVVENFFDIIYGVHVEMDGRGGKHAGQKRTYKAIAEMYSFLPREAVTHFLMSCADCQKRMHLSAEGGKGGKISSSSSPASGCQGNAEDEEAAEVESLGSEPPETPGDESPPPPVAHSLPHIDYSLPITTTYLKHMRSLGYSEEDALNPDREDSEDGESEIGEEPSSQPVQGQHYEGHMDNGTVESNPITPKSTAENLNLGARGQVLDMRQMKQENGHITWTAEEPLNMTKGDYSNNHMDHSYESAAQSPCNGCVKRETSATPDNLSAGTKDEDDEDEEDDPDKIDINKYDPERLKAFNMFVRLFVDENLDRMVPISRQPKDKIQAIIDSCARQFPEFGDRARKRIRTYLKSCRRNKRTRENSSWEMSRTTHPHLTSALAEQILASACENESQNAKRMRLGLKPVAAEMERGRFASAHTADTDGRAGTARISQGEILQNTLRHGRPSAVSGTLMNGGPYTQTTTTSPYRLVPNTTNSHPGVSHAVMTNGPTDLSMKKGAVAPPNSSLKYSLNPSEVTAVKQLIAGYRESAAFLLRSADELEQLLLQQN